MRQQAVAGRIFAMLGVIWALSSRSEACSCVQAAPPCEAFTSAHTVFIGRVVTVTNIDRHMVAGNESFVTWGRRTQFVVERVYKGSESKTVELETGSGGGDCGYGFQKGKSYLVYAYVGTRTKKLETNICTRTRTVELAADDLDYLNTPPQTSGTTRISGSIWHVGNELNNFAFVGPLVATKVVIEGESKRQEVMTDANGVYRALSLPPGKYSLKVELPSNLTLAFWKPETLSLEPRGCAGYDIYVQSNGRIHGRVINSNREGVQNIKVDLISADPKDRVHDARSEYAFPRSKWEYTRVDGRFSFEKIPAGHYFLGFSLDRPPSDSFPYPTTYYPGVPEVSRSMAIEVGEERSRKALSCSFQKGYRKILSKGAWFSRMVALFKTGQYFLTRVSIAI